mmetsp:Transcript_20127/g.40660  ORF Transcript_20127/g.40660 Transcript_20127/m.40660 type:complete len:109 (+) Transcript_20127:273-599(+)
MTSHAGEVSFPGGREEKGDASLVETALREAEEEMGLPRKRVTVLGQLEEVKSKHGLAVTPVIGIVDGIIDLKTDNLVNPESGEIEENFTVTLKDLYNPSNWVLVRQNL